VRFLIDAQLPPALARYLAAAGHNAEHVQDVNLEGAPDADVWRHALATGAAIITKDSDFSNRITLQKGPQVVWIRFRNTRTAELLRRIAPLLPDIVSALNAGDRLVEVV
jgi:predicted nuclease of predicted toxin-antitoxin system